MAENSKIEWTDHTFNPWEGCQKVGPGCDHCYAEARNARFGGGVAVNWGPGAPRRRTSASNWAKPLQWNAQAEREGRRYRVFCASLADVFDNAVPQAWRDELFALIQRTPRLDWLLLTKRIGNVGNMLPVPFDFERLYPNVWLGATVVNQTEADRDIPKLLALEARCHFISYEPALGPLDASRWLGPQCYNGSVPGPGGGGGVPCPRCGGQAGHCLGLTWVIAGGESGHHARPAHPDWFRDLRDQCEEVGTPFLFKQWGEWWEVDSDHRDDETGGHGIVEVPGIEAVERFDPQTDCLVARDGRAFRSLDELPEDTPARHMVRLGKKAAGRELDGAEHNGLPA